MGKSVVSDISKDTMDIYRHSNQRSSNTHLKILNAYFARKHVVIYSWHTALKNGYNTTGFVLCERLQDTNHLYVSLRFATNQETLVLDHAQQEARTLDARPLPIQKHHVEDVHEARTLLVFAYRRIAKHVIHLRQVYPASLESSPQWGEVDRQPWTRSRGYDISRDIKTRVCACKQGSTRTREHRGGYCVCQARQSTRRGLSPPNSVLITFFLSFFFTSTREKLAWRQCWPGITRVSNLKGHPSSWMYAHPRSV